MATLGNALQGVGQTLRLNKGLPNALRKDAPSRGCFRHITAPSVRPLGEQLLGALARGGDIPTGCGMRWHLLSSHDGRQGCRLVGPLFSALVVSGRDGEPPIPAFLVQGVCKKPWKAATPRAPGTASRHGAPRRGVGASVAVVRDCLGGVRAIAGPRRRGACRGPATHRPGVAGMDCIAPTVSGSKSTGRSRRRRRRLPRRRPLLHRCNPLRRSACGLFDASSGIFAGAVAGPRPESASAPSSASATQPCQPEDHPKANALAAIQWAGCGDAPLARHARRGRRRHSLRLCGGCAFACCGRPLLARLASIDCALRELSCERASLPRIGARVFGPTSGVDA